MRKIDLPKTLVIGAQGFVGSHFFHYFRQFYPDLIGTHYRQTENLRCFNLNDSLDHLALEDYEYALIAAGVANPRRCAEEPEMSFKCNVTHTLSLCHQCLKRQITPILFSTDYVFDGSQESYDEESEPTPLNEYGRQKAELEKQALKLPCLIIRLSKVYGISPGDGTLIDEMVTNLKQNREIRAASDQIFAPICINDVIEGVIRLQRKRALGLYNFGGPEIIDRFSLAKKAASYLKGDLQKITKISIDDLNDTFTRPKRTILNTRKIIQETALNRLTLDEALHHY